MIAHEEGLEAVPAYVAGHLDEDARRGMDEHLATCGACAELVEAWRELLDAMRAGGEAVVEPHPDVEALRAHALGSGTEDDRIGRHLTVCPSCRIEVEAWRRREADGPGARDASPIHAGRRPWPGGIWPAAATLAAGIALGLVLGHLRPTAPPEPEAPAPGAVPAAIEPPFRGGPLPLIVLPAPRRGADVTPGPRLDPRHPFVLLALPSPSPGRRSEVERFRFTIHGPDGGVVWSSEMSDAEVGIYRGTGEAVVFAVPTSALAHGRHEARVTGLTKGGSEVLLLRVPFEVEPSPQRQSPAATNAPQ